jgi:hypothetical protein
VLALAAASAGTDPAFDLYWGYGRRNPVWNQREFRIK